MGCWTHQTAFPSDGNTWIHIYILTQLYGGHLYTSRLPHKSSNMASLGGSEMNTFDYVVIGGGTAGLVVATRLAEDANTTVCVIEAGEDHTNDIDFIVPGMLSLFHFDCL